MINQVSFSNSEQQQINSKLIERSFTSKSWADSDLDNIKKTIKDFYLSEQSFTCPYCKQKIHSKNGRYWDIEHIICRSSVPNFMFEPLNLCMSCVDCNIAKSHKKVTSSKAKKKYPNKSSNYLIVHPHFDSYEDNIIVIKEGFYYVAKKPKGEKTIEICRLNRFYEFSEFGEDVQDDDRIFLLSEQLRRTDDINEKKRIKREIAELAIKGLG